MKKWVIPEVFFTLFALSMVMVILRLAPVGDPHLPGYADFGAHQVSDSQVPQVADSIALHYNRQAVVEVNAKNVVGAVIMDYRGYDTLYEATVLFTAVISVLSVLAIGGEHGKD